MRDEIEALRRALEDEGPNPVYHRKMRVWLEKRWPTLWRAIVNLLGAAPSGEPVAWMIEVLDDEGRVLALADFPRFIPVAEGRPGYGEGFRVTLLVRAGAAPAEREGRIWEYAARLVESYEEQIKHTRHRDGLGMGWQEGEALCREIATKLRGHAALAAAPAEREGRCERALRELYALVKGECPSLLDGDSDGSARLDLEIEKALAAAPREPESDATMEELAWGLIANVSGGDWSQQSPEWQEAAALWRDTYAREQEPPPHAPGCNLPPDHRGLCIELSSAPSPRAETREPS